MISLSWERAIIDFKERIMNSEVGNIDSNGKNTNIEIQSNIFEEENSTSKKRKGIFEKLLKIQILNE